MTVEKETNVLLWTIFSVGVLTVATIPAAWGMLGHTASTGAVKSSNMAQTLWGQSTPVSQAMGQMANSEAVAIIPGATTPHIEGVQWTTTTWGPQLTITGYGFGNPPASGQLALQIGDVSRGWMAGNTSSYGVTGEVSEWKNTQIVISSFQGYGGADTTNWADGLGSFVFAPGDTVQITVTNPQTGAQMQETGTYPQDAPMPTVTVNPMNTLIAGTTEAISGSVSFQGQPLANQAVNLSTSIGSFTGSGTQTSPTEYTVFTDSNGQWSATFAASHTSGKANINVMADVQTASMSVDMAPPFVVKLAATGDQSDNNVTLTATLNYPLNGAFTMSIINQTTGQVLASTTQGTSLTTQITMAQKETDSFIATVK